MYISVYTVYKASQVALLVKNLPANAGEIRDVGSIPELGRWGQSTPVFLPPTYRGAWWAKSWTPLKKKEKKSWTPLKQQHACILCVFVCMHIYLNRDYFI